MNDVCARLAYASDHLRANGRSREIEKRAEPCDANAVNYFLNGLALVVGDDDFYVDGLLQLATQSLQVRLHPARMRRIELAQMQHA